MDFYTKVQNMKNQRPGFFTMQYQLLTEKVHMEMKKYDMYLFG